MQSLTLALGIFATLALGAGLALLAHVIAARLLPEARPSTRLTAAFVVAAWLPVVLFWAMAPLHGFRVEIALGLAFTAATVAHRRLVPAAADLVADLNGLGSVWREAGPIRWLAIAVAVPVALLALRGLIAPPLAWDALTYHLVHAARYVQTAGLGAVDAPDAWGYYEYFPPSGEILWGWTMLPSHSDALLAPAGLAVWLAAVLAVYAVVRELGGSRARALLAALVVGGSPAVATFVTSTYVDPLVVALFAASTLFLARATRTGSAADLALAGAAAGVCASTKHSGLALLVLLAVCVTIVAWRAPVPASIRLRRIAIAAAVAALAAAPHYVRTMIETGNPVYPAALELLGLPGNADYLRVVAGTDMVLPPAWDLARRMFLGLGTPIQAPMHLGPAALLAMAIALAGLPTLLRRPGGRLIAAWLAASSAIVILALLSPDARGIVQAWWDVSGRFLGPALVAVAVIAALAPGRFFPRLLAAAVSCTLFFTWPRGLGGIGWAQVGWGALSCGFAAIGLLAARRLAPFGRVITTLATLAIFAAGVATLRDHYRTPTWEAVAARRTFDLHTLARQTLQAWPLWAYFDDGPPATLAVAAGQTLRGHNVFQYPLMGRRLQHRTLHVPTTAAADASIIGPGASKATSTERDAWVARLRETSVDYLVLLPPLPQLQTDWASDLPDVFRVVSRGVDDQGIALQITPAQ